MKVDVYIVNSCGSMMKAATDVKAKEAAKFAIEYSKEDDGRGLLLWPHGKPTPEEWVVREPKPSGSTW